jgi:outer membrane murein-binding lipoprotein Lpp
MKHYQIMNQKNTRQAYSQHSLVESRNDTTHNSTVHTCASNTMPLRATSLSKKQYVHKRIALALGAVVLLGALLSGCIVNDLPNEVGSEFVTDTLLLTTLSSDTSPLITSVQNGRAIVPIGSGNFFVGRSNDAEMYSFVRFSAPDTVSNVQASDIISCTMTIVPVLYGYGNITTGRLSFRAVEVLQEWTPLATVDTLAERQQRGALYGTRTIASYDGIGTLQSTQAVIEIPIDRALALRWLNTPDSTQRANTYGLAFLPNANGSVISSFYGAGTGVSPLISIRYRRATDTVEQLRTFTGFMQTSFSRTLQPVASNNDIVMQGGTALRSKMFFNLSMIPNLAIIHRADLFLTPDSLRSALGTESLPSILLARVAPDTTLLGSNFANDFQALPRDANTGRYTANITQLLQRWLFGRENNGLIFSLNATDENTQMARVVLFGRNADSTRRPLLRILYSRKK